MNYFAMPGLLKDFRIPKNGHRKLEIVLEAICNYFDVTRTQLFLTKGRAADVVERNQIAQYMLFVDANINKSDIGKMFEKDHTTVLHSVKTIQGRSQVDIQLRTIITDIRYLYQ